MSISQIMNNALSQLQVSQQALNVVSNNIANVNTDGYARERVDLSPKTLNGVGAGVSVEKVERVVNFFLSQEAFLSNGDLSYYSAKSGIHDQIQAYLGKPDSEYSLSGQISTLFQSLGSLTVNPSDDVARANVLNDLQTVLNSGSSLVDEVVTLRNNVNGTISEQVQKANSLLDQIFDLNVDISRELALGRDPNTMKDQRDKLINQLSSIVDVKTLQQPDGSVHLVTKSGFTLLSGLKTNLKLNTTSQLAIDGAPPQITVERINPVGGNVVQSNEILDNKVTSGSLAGLLEMRDETLPNLASEVSNLMLNLADQLNAVHNDNAAVPPPNTLTGVNTGLVSGDAHNFTGVTSLAVADSSGALISRIDLDFDAGTYSVDGAAPVAFAGTTVGDVVNGINTALGANGSASFTNGVLTIQANPSSAGLAFLQDSTNPSDRGGRGFSQFFGLNDLVTGGYPTHTQTGVSGTDTHGFTPGQTIDYVIRDSSGNTFSSSTFTVNAGTFNNLISDLNTAGTGLGDAFTFSLSASGELVATPKAGYEGYQIYIEDDTTQRGTTGVSLSDFFGLGANSLVSRARNLEINPTVANDADKLALAKLDLTSPVVGATVLSTGDNRGAAGLEALVNQSVSFVPAGYLSSQTATFGEYAATLISDIGLRADQADRQEQNASDLNVEVNLRKDAVQGVNMDEELSNMVVYQQSYNAAARVITAVGEMLDELLKIV